MPGPLDGLCIVDCSSGAAGPQASGLLCDYGAEVIWVEPAGGDPSRALRPAAASVFNRGKLSVTLDPSKPDDKDMIVMMHEIKFRVQNSESIVKSLLVVKGEDSVRTAMAKTVGLPLGIATKLILNGAIKLKGLHIPTQKEIYEPVLNELVIG